MTNQSTLDKLIEMRLTSMADAFRIQMDDSSMKEVPFEDRFGMLVDVEYSNRKNNRLKRLIRSAELEQPDASIAAIDYQSDRKLNKELISRLATCEYITEYRNIFITGATGSGKTYMACAFGMEACKHHYSVKYVRLPDLSLDLQAARDNNTFAATLKKYTKPVLLVIDEWLLLKLTETEARNLFELIHKRRKKSSTIFCSQFRESEWYQQICSGESTLADAIMDHISYDSYKIDIESIDPSKDLSMREVYGLDPAQAK
ncbi:ATP-binding protein [Blautia producta]|uniref:ATP-binding protein n=1 Tax=Blautia producta TaxID=33035 RepID=UPI002597C1A9|nr:ATP-binding protein [uncultured Blautia sp.]